MTIAAHELTAELPDYRLTLAPTSARIRMDYAWSPYVQVELTCAIPAGNLHVAEPGTVELYEGYHVALAGESVNSSYSYFGKTWTRVQHVSGGTARFYVTDYPALVDGDYYAVEALVHNPGATPVSLSIDWCDQGGGVPVRTINPGEIRLVWLAAARSTYSSIYRFMDISLTTVGDVLLIRDISIKHATLQPALEVVDPRDNPRISVTMTRAEGSTTTTRDLDLILRARVVNHSTGELQLTCESDEALLIDYARVASTISTDATTYDSSLRDIIDNIVLATFYTSLEADDGDDFDFSSADPDALSWPPGVTAWDFLEPLVQAAGLRLFCDEARNWHLVSPNYRVAGQVNITAGVNATAAVDTISRYADWHDSVVVEYSWTDSSEVPQKAWDSAGAPGTKTLTVKYNRPYPGAGAAAALLNRASGRGRLLALEATARPSATPRQTVQATLALSPVQTGYLTSIEWTYPEGIMRLGSGELIDTASTAWAFLDAGEAWTDSPIGESWVDE